MPYSFPLAVGATATTGGGIGSILGTIGSLASKGLSFAGSPGGAAAIMGGKSLLDFFGQKKRGKGARRKIGKQIGVLRERGEAVPEFYDELEAFAEEQFGLREESLLDQFLNRSYDITQERGALGRERESGIAQTGLAFSGGVEEQFRRGQVQTSREAENLRSEFQLAQRELGLELEGEKLGIGKAEEDELQALRDMIFRLKTERSLYA